MYIDTHCHLNFSVFDKDLVTILGNAKKAGIKKFIVPGDTLSSSIKAVTLSQNYPECIYAAAGFHPYEAEHNPDLDGLEKLILTAVPSRRLVAVGECGLDYHRYKNEPATGKKDRQKKLFADQVLLAIRYDLPVIIHCREAFADFFAVLDGLPTLPRGVIHCFSGGLADLRDATARNLAVGIDGNVTYSSQVQMVVPHIPSHLLLLETDAPLLTPVPYRGERNEPKYLQLIADKISKLTGKDKSLIEEETTSCAKRLFCLP